MTAKISAMAQARIRMRANQLRGLIRATDARIAVATTIDDWNIVHSQLADALDRAKQIARLHSFSAELFHDTMLQPGEIDPGRD